MITIVVVILFNLFEGSKLVPSIFDFKKCSANYWMLFSIEFFIILIIFIVSVIFVFWEIKAKELFDDFMPHEFNYPLKKIIILCIIDFFVGLFAYIAGVSGGVILFPLLTRKGL